MRQETSLIIQLTNKENYSKPNNGQSASFSVRKVSFCVYAFVEEPVILPYDGTRYGPISRPNPEVSEKANPQYNRLSPKLHTRLVSSVSLCTTLSSLNNLLGLVVSTNFV
ncbi:hypothetical protein EWB00_001909 [Schistosoma japonicum]|uniref:Uncharacterized protein n=1 Tax=Schistosoma japonicum TaxID=6182 RepID=A0A4Z2DE05_SCHJA|nr:hypothetical protein KSF78_0008092 [Schistosoma japonicum]TNN14742.1 hypothetical protein EWB00_001909 [Schistosoma japonicum]